MIPNDLDLRREMIDKMIVHCMNNADELTKWEYDFILSVGNQFDDRKNLSDKQCEILEKIYDKL